MKKLMKNYLYNLIYQVFLVIVPLITAPYLAKTLGAKALGTYSYICSVSSIITNLGLIGLNSYGSREIAYSRIESKKMNKVFVDINMLRWILLVVISVPYWILIIRSSLRLYFCIQYILILATFIDISWLMIGLEEMKIVALRNFSAKLLTVIGIFIFVKDSEDLWLYFAIFAVVTLLTLKTVGTFSWVDEDNFKKNYEMFINQFCDKKMLAVSPVYVDEKYFPGSNQNLKKYRSIISEVCSKKKNVYFFDIYSQQEKLKWKDKSIYGDDHFHPSKYGYEWMGKILGEQISDIMKG